MCKNVKKTMILGRIDNLGRLLLTPSQMKSLNFVEGETATLDFNNEGIIIGKSLGYSVVYDRIKVMPNGILIGRDICRSKLLMTDDRKTVDTIKIYNDNDDSVKDELSEVVHYNIEYWIDNDRIVIPLTRKQQQANLQVIRTVDELGRILIPNYIRNLHNLKTKTGIGIKEHNIIISNDIERKTTVDELGRIAIPQDVLDTLKIEPKTELEVETSRSIILSKATN